MTEHKHDVIVTSTGGSIYLVEPVSEEAKQWIKENVETEGYQWLGNALAVETRFAGPLIDGMLAHGLVVG